MIPVSNVRRADKRYATRRNAGLSLIELILALAITAMLLTATMVALDASFKAYAAAAEEASTQTQTRMIIQRLLTLIRTSTAHGPLVRSHSTNTSSTLELIDAKGNEMTLGYNSANEELWLADGLKSYDSTLEEQPLLTGVRQAAFFLRSRKADNGDWVLERATVDITVVPSPDSTLSLEKGSGSPTRVIASTMPRRLD